MLQYLKNEANLTTTENGAVTNASAGDYNLDLFATIGAIRHLSDNEIIDRFTRAYMEDKDVAMKILFFGRDVRGGLGERRVFRVILKWLAFNYPESVNKNLQYVAEFGRFDDLLCLFDTPCEAKAMEIIKAQLDKDLLAMAENKEVSLLGKWMPSINTSNKETVSNAKKLAKYLNMNAQAYRKILSSLRAYIKILENNLRLRDYTFDYSKQPSNAMHKYRCAFIRNDKERYVEYLESVSKGEAKMNTGNVYPYELVEKYIKNRCYMSNEEKLSLNTTWASLSDFGGDEDILAVIDGSGSMYGWVTPTPASVALSLGLYFAERNKGAFANHFITFSERPRLIELKGETVDDALCFRAAKLLDEYDGPYLVESFNPFLLRWFKIHRPEIARGQLVTNLLAEKREGNVIVNLVLSGMLLNFLSRPDIIACDARHTGGPAYYICAKLFRAKRFYWTVRDPEDFEAIRQSEAWSIFERFLPNP